MMTKGKLAGVLLGSLAAGVLIGVTIAPDKGSRIRQKLGAGAGKYMDRILELFSGLTSPATDDLSDLNSLRNDAVAKAAELKEGIRDSTQYNL